MNKGSGEEELGNIGRMGHAYKQGAVQLLARTDRGLST